MKASGLAVPIFLVLAGGALAGESGFGPSASAASGPDLVIDARMIELGTVIPGHRARRVLSLRNRGKEPLDIRLVRTSSGRLTAHLSHTRLPPASDAELRIAFSSEVWDRGPFTGQVVLYSNDPDQPVMKVKVKGVLRSPFGWSPRFLKFRVRRDDLLSLPEIEIVPQEGEPTGPVRVKSFVPYLFAEVGEEPSGVYVVTLVLDPSVPLGPILGWIRIETSHPQVPVLQIPVRGRVVGDLAARPDRLDFGIVEEGQPATAQIFLANTGGREVHVLNVEPHLPIEAEVGTVKKGRGYQISVRLPRPQPLQSLEGHLNVYTDHPDEPVVRVPVEGWVWTKRPFKLTAAQGSDARLQGLIRAALFRGEQEISAEDFIAKILGGVRDDRAVSLLMGTLESDNWYIRTRAIDVLGHLKNRLALEPVRKAVTDDVDEDVRGAAAAALVHIAGREALPELLLALQDDDDWVREDAADLLGALGDPLAILALKRALSDEKEDVREAAAAALKRLKGEESSPQSKAK